MNPYKIDGPAVISFSGGRTSGFMLAKIVEAHGGKLPNDVVPMFRNTGMEHPKTYEFILTVSRNIAPITWLEYANVDGKHGYKVVDESNYSRNGEPFEALIKASGYLPNPVTRKCTVELKIRTLNRYMARYITSKELDSWTNCVGLRADEPHRVAKMRGDYASENVAMPIAEAGHTLQDVLAFWKPMPFDLELPNNDTAFGNCTLCFLKSKARLQRVMRAEPHLADWWIRMEALGLSKKPSGARFRNDRPSYAGMLEISKTQSVMFDADEEDAISCACTE